MGVVRVFIIFQEKPVFRYEAFADYETFWKMWLNIGLSGKIIEIRTTPVLFSRPKQARTP